MFHSGGPSWFETVKYIIFKTRWRSKYIVHMRSWICQTVARREWFINDTMLYGQFCCTWGIKTSRIRHSLWHLVFRCLIIHYVGRVWNWLLWIYIFITRQPDTKSYVLYLIILTADTPLSETVQEIQQPIYSITLDPDI